MSLAVPALPRPKRGRSTSSTSQQDDADDMTDVGDGASAAKALSSGVRVSKKARKSTNGESELENPATREMLAAVEAASQAQLQSAQSAAMLPALPTVGPASVPAPLVSATAPVKLAPVPTIPSNGPFVSPFSVSATQISAAAAAANAATSAPTVAAVAAAAAAAAAAANSTGPAPSSLLTSTVGLSNPALASLNLNLGLPPLGAAGLMPMDVAPPRKKVTADGKQYNRKDKSLGLLCENFLKLYGQGTNKDICLDGAATALGVERRRIYDIVNILESVDIVSRRGKNQYVWHGTSRLAMALQQLEAAIKESGQGFQQVDLMGIAQTPLPLYHPNGNAAPVGPLPMLPGMLNANGTPRPIPTMQPPSQQITFGHGPIDDDEDDGKSKKKKGAAAGGDSRKEQSLGHLSQVFVQMFLSNDTRIVSLDDAGKWLLGGPVVRPGETEAKAQANFKSRVRRLYDIANVFTSLELIEKIHLTQTRKPAFKWSGARVYPLPSSVPKEAYTSDAPARRSSNLPPAPGLAAAAAAAASAGSAAPDMNFANMSTFMQKPPPQIPRRATIDTAALNASLAITPQTTTVAPSISLSTALDANLSLSDTLLSLSASFDQFDSIQQQREKRAQFEQNEKETKVKTDDAAETKPAVATKQEADWMPTALTTAERLHQPLAHGTAATMQAKQNLLKAESTAVKLEPLATGTTSAPPVARTPSVQQTTLLGQAATTGTVPHDPLLLAYAKVPATRATAFVSDAPLPQPPTTENAAADPATASLSERAGFPLQSSAYIRNSTDFISNYRDACDSWQRKMPTLKHLYLNYAFAAPAAKGAQ